MGSWKVVNLKNIVPDEIQTIVDNTAGVISGVSGIFSLLATTLDAAKVLLVAFSDPMAALVNELIQEIEDFLSDFQEAGVYVLAIAPLTEKDKRGTEEFIAKVLDSLEDELDPDRPTFSPSAQVAAYTFLVGAQDLLFLSDNFIKAMRKLFKFPSLQELGWLERDLPPDWPPVYYRSTAGKLPDWNNLTLEELFPPLKKAFSGMEQLLEEMKALVSSTTDFIDAFAEALATKVEQLNAIAQILQDISTALDTLFDISGVWYLPVVTNGNVGFATELANSFNKPPFDKNSYVAGIVVLAGGPGVPPLVSLLGGL